MSLFPRVTLRCLKNELKLPLPVAGEGLISDIRHPLLDEVKRLWLSDAEFPKERISSIEDNIFFKVKPNIPLRGIVWEEKSNKKEPWLVASGKREDGSKKDIYEKISIKSRNEAKIRNSSSGSFIPLKTYSEYLKPQEEDYARLLIDTEIEPRIVLIREVEEALGDARNSLGRIVSFEIGQVIGELKIVQEGSIGEIFLKILISFDNFNDLAIVLKVLRPDLSEQDWQIDYQPNVHTHENNGNPVFYCYTLWEAPWASKAKESKDGVSGELCN
jgi:hypothetical protein